MNSKEFEWDLKIVSPNEVQTLAKGVAECADEQKFLKERIEKVNQRIGWLEDEGRKKCYPTYTVQKIRFNLDKGGTRQNIVYQKGTKPCDLNYVAFMEAYFRCVIKPEHKRIVKLYEDYDKNENDFLYFVPKINELGGEIIFHRPYIDVVLPAPDSLQMVTYPDLACNQRNYSVLDALINTAAKTC